MIVLGKRIKQARELKKMTQETLAEMIGVSRTAIARWESGETDPTVEHLISLSNLLDVNASYLLGTNNKDHIIEILKEMSATLDQIAAMLREETINND